MVVVINAHARQINEAEGRGKDVTYGPICGTKGDRNKMWRQTYVRPHSP